MLVNGKRGIGIMELQNEVQTANKQNANSIANDFEGVVYASLTFTAKDLDPAKISETLGMKPELSFKRGEVRKDGKRIWSHGAWHVSSSDNINSKDLIVHINWMIDQLNPVKEELAGIVSQKEMNSLISCFWIMPQGPNQLQFSPEMLYALSEFGINVEFYFYPPEKNVEMD